MDYKVMYGEYNNPLVFKGVMFFQTCQACPEQYDAWYGDTQIGYIRLRGGHLTAEYPDVGGDYVYRADIGDSKWQGCFTDDEERCIHLCAIAKKLKEKYRLESSG